MHTQRVADDAAPRCPCDRCSAAAHSTVRRQQQVLAAWRAGAAARARLRRLLAGSVQRWSQLAVSRAFMQWKDWALSKASLHRRARALLSLLSGRTLAWAFCMLR